MTPRLEALWTAAIAAEIALTGTGTALVLEMARDGHPNARAYVTGQIAEQEGCPCGAEEYCNGVEREGRDRLRAALVELAAAMDEGEAVMG